MAGIAYLKLRQTPSQLTAMTSSISSSLMSASDLPNPRPRIPALAVMTCSAPKWLSAASTTERTSSPEDTSACVKIASPPRSQISWAARWPSSGRTSQTTTFAPSWA